MESPLFLATFSEPLTFGQILEIRGKVQQNAERVLLNFCHFPQSSTDFLMDFQILLDFIKKQIIFKQFQSKDNVNMITKDLILAEFLNDFKFYIMLAESKFHIALNNKPLVNFKYHQNLANLKIQSIKILGKLEYLKQLDQHKYFPYTWPPIQIYNDYLDFSNDQPMPFKPGHIMTITACLQGNQNGKFIIQFRHALDHRQLELEICVCFKSKKIFRNSKSDQANARSLFDDHEEFGGFTFISSRFCLKETDYTEPFSFENFSKTFKFTIAFGEYDFRLAKDGKYLCNYLFRSPNTLPYVMGPKIFGCNDLRVRVWGIEHLPLVDVECKNFEMYSL